ncbi:MAG: sulfatase [Candidatus Eisenbacteria bacterium]
MALLALGGLGSGFACARERTPAPLRRPDLVFISIDTLRRDHLGLYGYGRDTSPTLDSLATQAVTFENAFVQASWTLPSHVSMMTSTYPLVHQVDTERRSIPETLPLLAESLQAGGYRTVGFVSWIYLAAKFGFARGFDRYHELLPPPRLRDRSSKHSTRAHAVVDSVLAWADAYAADGRPDETPFFLFVHFFDPHMDYDPPLEDARRFDPTLESTEDGTYRALEPYIAGLHGTTTIPESLITRATALYDGEIRYTDREVGRLFGRLRTLGLLENAVVAVTSDHGEEFGEHGSMEGHQWTLYDDVLRVPLLISVPPRMTEAPPGRRKEIVESIDLAPTLLAFAGIDLPASYQGRALQPLLEDAAGGARDGRATSGSSDVDDWPNRSFAEIGRFVVRASLRTPRHKLIHTRDTGGANRFGVPVDTGFQLFDIREDPGELHDRFDPADSTSQRLSEELRAWIRGRGAPEVVPEPVLTPEERERLRSVGYIGR